MFEEWNKERVTALAEDARKTNGTAVALERKKQSLWQDLWNETEYRLAWLEQDLKEGDACSPHEAFPFAVRYYRAGFSPESLASVLKDWSSEFSQRLVAIGLKVTLSAPVSVYIGPANPTKEEEDNEDNWRRVDKFDTDEWSYIRMVVDLPD